jgi:hypothetical protein
LTVTVTYPLLKSKVAVATCRPSGAFSCAASASPPADGLVAATDDDGEPLPAGDVVLGCVLGFWLELQALTAITGSDTKRVAAQVSLIMSGA